MRLTSFRALSSRGYRLLLTSSFLVWIAAQMRIVAINWQMYQLTHSALVLGLIGIAAFVPILLIAPIGGAIVDIIDRKKLIMVTALVSGFIALVLFCATYFSFISPQLLLAMVALNALVLSFEIPARQSVIPLIVPKNILISAISFTTLSYQTSVIIGPSIAGFLIDFFGVKGVYFVNMIAYLLALISLLRVTIPHSVKKKIKTVSLPAIIEGLRFVFKSPLIFSTMMLDFFATFFAAATILLPIFAQDIYHVGPKGLGILYAAPSVGAVVAGLILASYPKVRFQGLLIIGAIIIYGLATIAFGLTNNMLIGLLFLAIIGGADMVSTVIRNTMRQLITPNYLRGRMVSINMIFFMGGPYLGEAEAGLLAAAIGVVPSVVIGGMATVILTSIVGIAVPKLRKYHNHEESLNS